MTFSYNKSLLLKDQKGKALSTFLIALGVAAAFFVPFIVLDKGYFIFYGDFNVQQIPFYQTCHEAVKSGNIFWNWNTDLGTSFIGSYSFYLLGSPFFWLTIPFPNWMVPYLMGPLLILKFACAALTGYLFIRRFTRNAQSARLGGLLYAFSGFSVYNIFFNHFHEAIIIFPLLLLSLELLITENKRGFFAFMVFLSAVSNYFFFFGMVVFTVIYFFVRIFSNCIKVSFSRFLSIAFEAVLGVGLSAIILLPSVLAVMSNTRVDDINLGWNAIMYGKEQIYLNIIECFFFPPDLPARPVFFPGADVKWSSLGGWLPLFSMVGVFAFCQNRRGHWLKRIICISFIMAMFPFLNSAFYAFNTAYYARWFYMPILMMSLATITAVEDSDISWKSAFRWVMFITLAFTLVIGFFPQQDSEGNITYGLYSQDSSNMYVVRFFVACGVAIISLLLLRLILTLKSAKNLKIFYRYALVLVCIISVAFSAIFVGTGKSHSYSVNEVMIPQLIEGEVELPENSDNYRIDVYDGVDNTGMFLGLSSINAFHSVVSPSIMDFYSYIGENRDVASRPDVEYEALRSLLSVKYLLNRTNGDSFLDDDNNPRMTGFSYYQTVGEYYVYENINYIPYGFSYDYYMTETDCGAYAKDERVRMMLKAILLSDADAVKYSSVLPHIDTIYENANGDYSAMLTDDEQLAIDCAQRKLTSAVSFIRDNKGFSSTVVREKENLVFFSVPYDDGWTATVNGQKAEIIKANVGFMAVLVPSGTSVIRFDYTAPGLIDGIKITGICAAVLLIYAIAANIVIKRKEGTNEYPEGDALILKWKDEQIIEAQQAESDDEYEDINEAEDNRSILNDLPTATDIPQENRFENGFTINLDAFKNNPKNDENKD